MIIGEKELRSWEVNHLGVIPDGNRRWGELHNVTPQWKAHKKGIEKLDSFLDWCLETEISKISIYTLSTENLARNPQELSHLLAAITKRVDDLLTKKTIHRQKVKIRFLGKRHRLPSQLLNAMNRVMDTTETYNNKVINFLIDYGAKYELVNAFNKMAKKAMEKKENGTSMKVTQQTVKNHLLEKEPLDLIIRTGKEHRLSNFMLWQASYAEIYTSDKLWPAFEKEDFYDILQWYKDRQRRFGQ